MTLSDTIQRAIDSITARFGGNEDEIYEEMMGDEAAYPIIDNAALQPEYVRKSVKEPAEPRETREHRMSKTVDMNRYRGYEVIVCEPACYDDAMSIVKHLKDRKTAVIKLDMLDRETALRIVDFLCGAVHALGGSQQKIGDAVFIFTPVNVSLSAEPQKSKFLRDALWSQAQA